jgi:hypothetical protein
MFSVCPWIGPTTRKGISTNYIDEWKVFLLREKVSDRIWKPYDYTERIILTVNLGEDLPPIKQYIIVRVKLRSKIDSLNY